MDRPPRALAKAKTRDPEYSDGNTTDVLPKLLPKSEGPCCLRSATDTVVHTAQDGVTTSVCIDHVTKFSTGCHVSQLSGPTGGETDLEAKITEAATGAGATVQDSENRFGRKKMKKTRSSGNLSGIAVQKRACRFHVRWYGYIPL